MSNRHVHLDRLAQLVADYRLALSDKGYPVAEWLSDLAIDLRAIAETVDDSADAAWAVSLIGDKS